MTLHSHILHIFFQVNPQYSWYIIVECNTFCYSMFWKPGNMFKSVILTVDLCSLEADCYSAFMWWIWALWGGVGVPLAGSSRPPLNYESGRNLHAALRFKVGIVCQSFNYHCICMRLYIIGMPNCYKWFLELILSEQCLTSVLTYEDHITDRKGHMNCHVVKYQEDVFSRCVQCSFTVYSMIQVCFEKTKWTNFTTDAGTDAIVDTAYSWYPSFFSLYIGAALFHVDAWLSITQTTWVTVLATGN